MVARILEAEEKNLDEFGLIEPAVFEAEVETLRNSGTLSDAEADLLLEFDKAVGQAEDLGPAYRQAAVCMLRRA